MPSIKYTTPEWMYRSIKGIFKSLLSYTYKVRSFDLQALDSLDRNQGFLIAANHHSIVDAFVMGLEIDTHRVRFVGRERTLWSNPFIGKINDIIGTIPVPERRQKNKSIVIETSVNAAKEGACIGIYPEGAILAHRKRFEGKTGMARIALEAGVPIVPTGLLGTDGLWPYGAKMPRLGRPVRMYVGEPIWLDDYHGMHENRSVVAYVTDKVMKEIRSLSGWYGVSNDQIVKLYQKYEKITPPVI